MRYAIAAILTAGVLAGPVHAVDVQPRMLVIRTTDVPAGYSLDRSESGLRTNAQAAKEFPGASALFRRWGRLTGYQVVFDRGERTIEARVDVFRSGRGPREMLEWADRQVRLSGVRGIRRANPRIGAESLLIEVGSPPAEVYVYWRYRAVWSAVGGYGLSKARALALARLQQGRIVAAIG